MPKLIRITTVPMALKYLLPGQMKFMNENGFEVLMISADGPERNEIIESEGCPHTIVAMTRKITPLKDLFCLLHLIKIFRKEMPDIVHTHTPKAGLLGMIAAKICGVKFRIHTVAGLPLMVESGLKFKLLTFIEKMTYFCANNVWPNSYSLLNFIIKNKLSPTQKLKIINNGSSNGIDLKRFNKFSLDQNILSEVKKSFEYSEINTYLLCIGRIVKDKGIIELVETFKIIHPQYLNTKLLLVGKFEKDLDPLPTAIEKEINENPNIIHINFSLYVEYYFSLANLFVFPSHREGFPNVLLQAGAMNLPIICSDIPGNVDIIDNNVTGSIFPIKNTAYFMNSIVFALENPDKMKLMSFNLNQKITNSFDRNAVWNAILKEYNKMILRN